MAKLSFPHMGNLYAAVKTIFEELGCDVLMPLPTTRRTIELGTKKSEEDVCFPYKVTLGNMIESLDNGANLLIMIGGSKGRCRLAYYNVVQEKELRDMGYKDFKIFNISVSLKETIDELRKLVGNPPDFNWKLFRAFKKLWAKLGMLEKTENLARQTRPYEINKGETSKVMRNSLEILEEARTRKDIKEAEREIYQNFRKIQQNRGKNVLKVGIVGEFFVVLEPKVNHHLEEKLGEMDVLVSQHISVKTFIKRAFKMDWKRWYIINRFSKKYFEVSGGGEDQMTIGMTEYYARKGYDGIVELQPFGCLPETAAKPVLHHLSRKYSIPILPFSIDEQSGEEGMNTRLEAFVDMLWRKRKALSLNKH